jgi:hypothetical protein
MHSTTDAPSPFRNAVRFGHSRLMMAAIQRSFSPSVAPGPLHHCSVAAHFAHILAPFERKNRLTDFHLLAQAQESHASSEAIPDPGNRGAKKFTRLSREIFMYNDLT